MADGASRGPQEYFRDGPAVETVWQLPASPHCRKPKTTKGLINSSSQYCASFSMDGQSLRGKDL